MSRRSLLDAPLAVANTIENEEISPAYRVYARRTRIQCMYDILPHARCMLRYLAWITKRSRNDGEACDQGTVIDFLVIRLDLRCFLEVSSPRTCFRA